MSDSLDGAADSVASAASTGLAAVEVDAFDAAVEGNRACARTRASLVRTLFAFSLDAPLQLHDVEAAISVLPAALVKPATTAQLARS